ncbi:Peptidoglycan/xylan/chitin deacetylase, PgdA/CDA1 family [Hathewaya proteolytica DSM 3090]|uniref:Peptidoglycan/xylan/chitin deacetylase, PgdA/CDA1 family n=1 Tax=Hathewaya proteolytica DSM 3090 TaxID=1121331 RepID=A0A1M6P4F4_9CLOT|nr:polysaccharide deacetylase family protein [Hathewaya proteolytica]SHK02782.1 Peptidoglycan/xylan/chitin deacetylase, PgdA/CDA1 family [Hathewaya proteolytica DSM 3090]
MKDTRRQSTYRKKTHNSVLNIILFSLFLVCFAMAIFTQAQGMKIKSNKKNLETSIQSMETDIKKTEGNIETLNKDIETLAAKLKKQQEDSKIVYLTFDDGPSSNTMKILDILKQNNVKATFFVNGKPELEHLYKAIADGGHTIANHTYSHDYNKIYQSPEAFKADVKKLDDFIERVTGQAPLHLLRFPGGSNNLVGPNRSNRGNMKNIIQSITPEYIYFDWNVDSTDASTFKQSKEKIVSSVLNEAVLYHNSVVLMHDLNPKTTTPEALPEIISGLKEKGYDFDKLTRDSFAPQFTRLN